MGAEEELEAVINAPGNISGLSKNVGVTRPKRGWREENLPPAVLDLFGFQLFSIWRVPLKFILENIDRDER